jgi:hypothetical protein
MPARGTRWSLPAAVLACWLLAACGGGKRSDSRGPLAEPAGPEVTASRVENAAERTEQSADPVSPTAVPGRLAAAMSAACRRDVGRLDAAHARAAGRAAEALAARQAASASLERLRAGLATAKQRMTDTDVAYQEANAPLASFLEANPERYLQDDDFAEYERLKAASDAAAQPYRAAVREHNDLVAEHNRVVGRFNTLTGEVNALAQAAHRRQDRFRTLAHRCLAGVDGWERVVAPLEGRLAAPATAALRDAPFAEVRCDAPRDWEDAEHDDPAPASFERAGYVIQGEATIHLAPRACLALDMLFSSARPTLVCVPREVKQRFAICTPSRGEAAVALTTLAHEAQHVGGVGDEAQAECYAIQTVDTVARALGLPAQTAAALGQFTRRRVSLPSAYRSDECRRGRALDLQPDTPAFP